MTFGALRNVNRPGFELTHLLEPTHNSRFIALMDQFMPEWRFYKDELNRLPVRHEDWRVLILLQQHYAAFIGAHADHASRLGSSDAVFVFIHYAQITHQK